MALSIHEVLFRLTGDEDDARKSLETITAELEAFNAIEAEAEADLDTTGALLRLRELEGALNDLDERTASPNIKADVAGVMAQLAALQAELQAIDDEDVTVDIDRRNELLSKIAVLSRQTTLLGRASARATGDFKSFGSRIADTAVNFGPFTTQVRTAVPLVGALAGVVVSLAGAVVALVSSLAAAVAGLASLGVALGGVFSAGILAAIVAIQRFKEESKKPGTPAHELLQAWQEITNVIKELGPLVDPIFSALAQAAHTFAGLLRSLGPALGKFARDAAKSLGPLIKLMRDPAFVGAIQALIRMAGNALRPMVRIFSSVMEILTNVARAAMPFLVDALKDVAGWLGKIADSTSDVDKTRGIIGVMVKNLRLWVQLLGAIAGLFLGIFKAALPAGEDLVKWLRDGVRAMTDWVNSSEGQERIKQFFEDTLPLAKQVIEAVAKIVLAFIQLGQIAAPILTPIVQAFNAALDALNWVLEKIAGVSGGFRQLIAVILLFFSPLSRLRLIVAAVVAVFGEIGHVAVSAFNAARHIAGSVGRFLEGLFHKVGAVASAMFKALPAVVSAIWNKVKSIILGIVNTIRSGIVGAWRAIQAVNRAVFGAISSVIQTVFGGVRDFLVGAANRIKGVVTGAWNAIKNGASTAFHAVVNTITGAIGEAWDFLKGLPAKAFEIGKDIIQGIADGLKSIPGLIKDTLEDVVMAPVNGVKSLLGIGSPSKLTMGYGEEVARGFAIGIGKMLRTVSRSAQAMAAAGIPKVSGGGAGLGAAAAARASGGAVTNNKLEIPVTVAGGNGEPDHRVFVASIERELRQRGLSIA